MDRNPDTIPIEECKNRHLYIIKARNSFIGIYNEKEKSFFISRWKFNSNFLFEEYHWDTGAPFGTAMPLKDLGLVTIPEHEMVEFLNEKMLSMKDDLLFLYTERWHTKEELERDFKWTVRGWDKK